LRDLYGVTTFIVGFRFVTSSDRIGKRALKRFSYDQVIDTRGNLAVITDASRFSGLYPSKEKCGESPSPTQQDSQGKIFLTTAEGGFVKMKGTHRSQVLQGLLAFINKRQRVNWFATDRRGDRPSNLFEEKQLLDAAVEKAVEREATFLLRLAIDAHLLTSHPGNISYRYPPIKR